MTADAKGLRGRLRSRQDPLNGAVLAFPLFAIYQVGILLGARGQNGVDFSSRLLLELSQYDRSTYLQILLALLAIYLVALGVMRRSRKVKPRSFVPVLLESAVYALAMGSLIVFIISNFLDFVPGLAIAASTLGDVIVISAGAGFHEELFFRVILMGGLATGFGLLAGPRSAWLAALLVSAVLFSWVHHLGPGGEPFTVMAFTYRSLAGIYFGIIYHFRGFGVAAWSHALYDLFVMTLG